jgi:peroxiredoxin
MRQLFARAKALSAPILFIGVCLSGVTGCEPTGSESIRATEASNTVPNADQFELTDIDGKPVHLRESSKGSVHVVIFVRSDCPISNRSAPEVRELCSAFQPQGVDVYLIYVDPRESAEAIHNHIREYEYTCPALRDSKHALATATEASVTPEAVVFDKDWKIVYRGRINNQFEDFGKSREKPTTHDLKDAIDATLAGRTVAEPVTKAIGCYIDDLK